MPNGSTAAAASGPATATDLVGVLADAALALHGEPSLSRLVAWASAAACDLTGAQRTVYVPLATGGIIELREPPSSSSLRGALDKPMSRGVTVRVDDAAVDDRFGVAVAVGERAASFLAVPVRSAEGTMHGYLLATGETPHQFDDEHRRALEMLGTHLGVALDRHLVLARLAAAQHQIVHALQEAVLPPPPDVPSAELGRYYVGAENAFSTGGDLYDWVVLGDGDLQAVVVDIMGKGVAATKDALSVTHALRLLSIEGTPLERLIARADSVVTAHNPDLVATVIVARYTPSTGRLRLAGAGHPPPLLVRGGRVEELSAPGIPIGWPGAGSAEVVETTLGRGDTIVLYTDGLVESTRDILAGLEHLRQAVAETAGYPASGMARALVDRALAGAVRQDDSLALVLRRRVPPTAAARPALAPFEYRFSPHTAAISLARNLLSDWLKSVPVDEAETADLVLVASELCTNAVRHAQGPGGVALRARIDGTDIVLEVEDDGGDDVAAVITDGEPPPADAEAGRGLFLVDALTDEVDTASDGTRTIVRCRKRAVIGAG